MRRSLKKSSSAFKQLMVTDKYKKHSLSSIVIGKSYNTNIANPLWWEDTRHIVALAKPIIHRLRMIDSLLPCLGKTYEGMDKMAERLQMIEIDPSRFEVLRQLCHGRWEAYH